MTRRGAEFKLEVHEDPKGVLCDYSSFMSPSGSLTGGINPI